MLRTCKECGVDKQLDDFPSQLNTNGTLYRRLVCRVCLTEKQRASRLKNQDSQESFRKYQRRYYQDNKQHRQSLSKESAVRHKDAVLQRQRDKALAFRKAVIEKYGGACACCGEKEYHFLTIDHINNDGAYERKTLKLKGTRLHQYMIDTYQPDRYQVLCWNCNCSKAILGVCPHVHIQSAE